MNKPYILSNVTPEVFFRDHCTDLNAVEFYESAGEEIAEKDTEIAILERKLEIAEEQLEYASRLVEKIERALDHTTAKEIKRDCQAALNSTMFEL